MPDIDEIPTASAPDPDVALKKPLSPAARRALEEAARRRTAQVDKPAPAPEVDGRAGPEPVRYGDWEVKGLATDF